jgi:competence protein ComEC
MAALALLAGTAVQLQQQALWPQAAYAALCAAAVMLACLACGLRSRPAVPALLGVTAGLLLGLGGTGWRAAERLGQALPAPLEGQDLQVVGVVASLPQFHADGARFRFEVESASLGGQPVAVPPLVSLGWYAVQRGSSLQGLPQATLRAGQRWRFTVRLRQPHGNLNPHGFDYELWLFEQGIRATGYVRDNRGAAPERLDEQAGHRLDRWRQQVRDAIERRVADPHAAGVLAALAIGDQGAIVETAISVLSFRQAVLPLKAHSAGANPTFQVLGCQFWAWDNLTSRFWGATPSWSVSHGDASLRGSFVWPLAKKRASRLEPLHRHGACSELQNDFAEPRQRM